MIGQIGSGNGGRNLGSEISGQEVDHALDDHFNTIGSVGLRVQFCRRGDGQSDPHLARGRGRCADPAIGQRSAHLAFGY